MDASRSHQVGTGVTAAAMTGVTISDGYFGAGSEVLMIAVLLLTVEPRLLGADALKNVMLVTADLLPAALFAILGHVVWSAALAPGSEPWRAAPSGPVPPGDFRATH